MYVVLMHEYDDTEVLGVWPTAVEAVRHVRDVVAGRTSGGVSVERFDGSDAMGSVSVRFWEGKEWSFRVESWGDKRLDALNDALYADLDAARGEG